MSDLLPHQEELWERGSYDLQIPEGVSKLCVLILAAPTCSDFLSPPSQQLPAAPPGQEGRPPAGAEGQRERLGVSGAQEDRTVRRGLPPQRADLRGEEASRGGLR